MERKYEFTGETKLFEGICLKRIRALYSFKTIYGIVNAGDLGGWIENERNLDHAGRAWVGDEACVMGKAQVNDCAAVYGNATVEGDILVSGLARVFDSAYIFTRGVGKIEIQGSPLIYESAELTSDRFLVVDDSPEIFGDTNIVAHSRVSICGNAKIFGFTMFGPNGGRIEIKDNAEIHDARISRGNITISGNAKVNYASISGNFLITDNAVVSGDALANAKIPVVRRRLSISGMATFNGNAYIDSESSYLSIGPFGRDVYVTFFRDQDGQILVTADGATRSGIGICAYPINDIQWRNDAMRRRKELGFSYPIYHALDYLDTLIPTAMARFQNT